MKKINLQLAFLQLALLGLLASCNNNKVEPDKPTAERAGLFVLSEGIFNQNNSSLTYYDFASQQLTADQFKAQNNRGLGDTGNDIAVYGSKMYIIVNVSSTVEVVDARTARIIKQIELKNNGVGRQPRFVVFNKNKAFISSYDGTVAVLDTASLNIDKFIPVGSSPEQMAISNGKLFVANSGGLNYPDYDSTVSVVDLNTLAEIKKITVGLNPTKLAADQYGDVYVYSAGNYGSVASTLSVIDDKTNAEKARIPFMGSSFTISGDYAYILQYDGKINLYNVKTDAVEKENFITDGTSIGTPNGVSVDELTGEVFVANAKDYKTSGEVICFSKEGTKKYAIPTGISPKKVVFVNK